MPRFASAAVLGLVLTLAAGCQSGAGGDGADATPRAPKGDSTERRPIARACPADGLQHLIGQPASAAEAVPAPKRVIRPGQAVTMDHRPERTNVHLDGEGVIRRITCG